MQRFETGKFFQKPKNLGNSCSRDAIFWSHTDKGVKIIPPTRHSIWLKNVNLVATFRWVLLFFDHPVLLYKRKKMFYDAHAFFPLVCIIIVAYTWYCNLLRELTSDYIKYHVNGVYRCILTGPPPCPPPPPLALYTHLTTQVFYSICLTPRPVLSLVTL